MTRIIATLWLLLPLISGCMYASKVPDTFGSKAAHDRLTQGTLPKPAHVVIVIEENKAYSQIIGNPNAPFLNKLAADGALFQHAYGVTHPSEPNYLALFSGSTQSVLYDSCPLYFTDANLASELDAAGLTFAVYSQGLPYAGFRGCRHGSYARKHNPAVNWQGVNVAPRQNRPFTAFPKHFGNLPTVSLVIPDIDHDMHSASIRAGDRWLHQHLQRYAHWAQQHDSLLIVTWDEDNRLHRNHIATIAVGSMVKPGHYTREIDHYSVLRTLEAMYHLPLLGQSALAAPITEIWRSPR